MKFDGEKETKWSMIRLSQVPMNPSDNRPSDDQLLISRSYIRIVFTEVIKLVGIIVIIILS